MTQELLARFEGLSTAAKYQTKLKLLVKINY